MAGHSKWANIQHRKGRQDAKRGKLFTKLIREITVASKLGGGDPDANPRLRAAIDNALSNNMTKDTIERAIKRGAGGDDDGNVEEIRYEGYGPGGVAVMVDCMTDNKNRTVDGNTARPFQNAVVIWVRTVPSPICSTKTGLLSYPADSDEDALMGVALVAGAEDIIPNDDGSIDIITAPNDFIDVKEAMINAGYEPEAAEITMRASTNNTLDLNGAQTMVRLLDMLEDLDDVQKVYSNADIPDDVLAQLS